MKKKSQFFLGAVLAVLMISAGSLNQAIAQVPVPNKQALLRELQSLYPHFNSAQINAKIIAAKNPDEFFRSFIPLYYNTLKNNPSLLGHLVSMAKDTGWCAGDGHFSNFGVMLDDRGLAQFTINDLDDAGPCPLMTDILRLLVATSLTNRNYQYGLLLQHYQAGLNKTPYQASAQVMKLLRDGRAAGRKVDPGKLSAPDKLLRKQNDRELTAVESDSIKNYIKQHFSTQTQVLDHKAFEKEDGGSYGLTIITVLINFDSKLSQSLNLTNPQIIEFKQQVLPGVFPLILPQPVPPTPLRILNTLKVEQGPYFSKIYDSIKFDSKEWLVRPDWLGQFKIKFKDLPDADIHAVTQDDFYVLGLIHSSTATQNYLDNFDKSELQDWLLAATNLNRYFTLVYQNLK
jgi:hypothetical protein